MAEGARALVAAEGAWLVVGGAEGARALVVVVMA